jgi:hypothetical protein
MSQPRPTEWLDRHGQELIDVEETDQECRRCGQPVAYLSYGPKGPDTGCPSHAVAACGCVEEPDLGPTERATPFSDSPDMPF